MTLRPEVPATEAGNLKIAPNWSGEGAKGVLVCVDQMPFALVQKRLALVQNRVADSWEKTPFAPALNHFGQF